MISRVCRVSGVCSPSLPLSAGEPGGVSSKNARPARRSPAARIVSQAFVLYAWGRRPRSSHCTVTFAVNEHNGVGLVDIRYSAAIVVVPAFKALKVQTSVPGVPLP